MIPADVIAAWPGTRRLCDECDSMIVRPADAVRAGAVLCNRHWWATRRRGGTDPRARLTIGEGQPPPPRVIKAEDVTEWGRAVFRDGPLSSERRSVPAFAPATIRYFAAGEIHFYTHKAKSSRTYEYSGSATPEGLAVEPADAQPAAPDVQPAAPDPVAAQVTDDAEPAPLQASVPERKFSLEDFHRLTPDLSGNERLRTWLGLPVLMRDEANGERSDRLERDGRATWVEECLGICSAQEQADEIAYLWENECSKVPLGYVGEWVDDSRPAESARSDGEDDLLAGYGAAEYVPMLTGREAGRDGKARCPFHGDGEERTPSLHLYEMGWYCFGCGQGGTIIDFGAALYGIEPRGAGFHEIRRRLAADLLRSQV